MKHILGISGLLIAVFLFTGLLEPNFLTAYNLQNTLRWTGSVWHYQHRGGLCHHHWRH